MSKNPKLYLSNYFDSLIRQVDIFTEERLAELDSADKLINVFDNNEVVSFIKKPTYADQIDQVMDFEEVEDFRQHGKKKIWTKFASSSFYFEEKQPKRESRRMKTSDYWNENRDELLAKLNEYQKEAFDRYETIRNDLKGNSADIESIIKRVFENKFVFILGCKDFTYSIHLIELDFYLNPYECGLFR